MPLYDYRCDHCGHTSEQRLPHTATAEEITCPDCGRQAKRVYASPAIHFKGSGFHNTDYKRKKEHGAKDEKPTPQETKEKADAATPKPAEKSA